MCRLLSYPLEKLLVLREADCFLRFPLLKSTIHSLRLLHVRLTWSSVVLRRSLRDLSIFVALSQLAHIISVSQMRSNGADSVLLNEYFCQIISTSIETMAFFPLDRPPDDA